MIYPIKHSDLLGDVATDDEQATMIVVEAIVSNTFGELEIDESLSRDGLKSRVENWEKFEDYVALISEQKRMLSRTIASNLQEGNELNKSEKELASRLASKAFEAAKSDLKAKKRSQIYASFSMAACALLVIFGLSVFLDPGQSGTKSNSNRVASSESKSIQRNETESEGNVSKSADGFTDPAGKPTPNSAGARNDPNTATDNLTDSTSAPKGILGDKNAENSSSTNDSPSSLFRALYLIGIGLAGVALLIILGVLIRKKISS